MNKLLGDVLYLFCGHTGVDAAALTMCVFQYYRASCNNGVTFNYRIIHHNRAHADQYIIMYSASMYNGIMPDRYIVSDGRTISLIGTMYTGAILDINLVTNTYKIYITAYDCIEPYTALITHGYVPYDRSIGRQETIITKHGQFAFNGEYE